MRKKLPGECAINSLFYCELHDGKLHLKRQHHYFNQVMNQMVVLEVQWADFVIWTKKKFPRKQMNSIKFLAE